ncbi:hypothetical protein [Bacillus mojavensis]|uniref:hypothetical protein n=1 Tax=Bacillus mojavensis TaxID=72360 RepID=UPI002DBC3D39|nr:hypothetical protein [Bacillus mojavensis]MEC1622178.1 hypothetical protein [Bacillus mojavensis]
MKQQGIFHCFLKKTLAFGQMMAAYISSTPKNLIREANELARKQSASRNKRLKENILRAKGKAEQVSYS